MKKILNLVPPQDWNQLQSSSQGAVQKEQEYLFALAWELPMTQAVKIQPAVQETPVQSLGQKDTPREGNDSPLQYSCLEKSYGRRSLVGYSPWGCKESDMWLTVSVTGSYSLVSKVNVKEREEEFSAPPFLIYS